MCRTYALVRRTDGAVIGAFDLRQSSPTRLGYGYVLARPFWGHGLMTEALTEIVGWALRQPLIWRIGDVCDVENLASARVMEKADLEREGVLRRWGVHPNLGEAPNRTHPSAYAALDLLNLRIDRDRPIFVPARNVRRLATV
jgi:ribosomal-protein-alanine N-acetyltransferase